MTADAYRELADLLKVENQHNEIACGAYLQFALPLLLARTPIEIIKMEREERSFFGASDFVVSAKFRRDAGGTETAAYIWEVKSAQCCIMTKDENNNRYAPSKDLYKAENQLIHYLHDATNNGAFRDRYGVGATGPVYAGGIIIGTDARVVAKGARQDPAKALDSLTLRRRYLYRHEQIRVLTWDDIMHYLAPTQSTALAR